VTVVAIAHSKQGGRLDCGHQAKAGQQIFKLDLGERGGQTSQGNGRGAWVCAVCAAQADDPEPV
jgi:hypothetical protein